MVMTQSNPLPDNAAANTIASSTSSSWLAQYEHERLENVRQQLPGARRQLQDAGVECVHIKYDGCGDSGQIESITYTDGNGKPVELAGKTTITEDQLMDLFYDLTQARHPGWENNDGAFGEFEWNLRDDALKHTHNDRFTDYDTTEHEGL
jgi:hypothetical protein